MRTRLPHKWKTRRGDIDTMEDHITEEVEEAQQQVREENGNLTDLSSLNHYKKAISQRLTATNSGKKKT